MKTKRILAAALAVAAVAATGVASVVSASETAKPSTHKVYVDGERANVAAYEISGNNYFKHRDVAAILSGTAAQFEVSWDEASQTITLADDKAYTTVGGEMGSIPAASQVAEESTAAVYRDGTQVHYTGYNINDNNYYKLRDIAEDFDFGVTWDNDTQSVLITTDEGYVPEGETPAEPETPVEPEDPVVEEPETPEYSMTSPAVGEYSDFYQDYLDNCGEEIVTCMINYTTYDGRTTEKGTYGGFEAAVWTLFKDNYYNDDSPFDGNYPVTTIWVDESGSGTFQLKMPKSLYDGTMDGNVYMYLGGAGASNNNQVEINGKMEYIAGSNISDDIIRENRPSTLLILIG